MLSTRYCCGAILTNTCIGTWAKVVADKNRNKMPIYDEGLKNIC
jgi:hypothetical protein